MSSYFRSCFTICIKCTKAIRYRSSNSISTLSHTIFIFFSFYIHHRLFISRSSLYFSVGTKLLSSSFLFCFPPRIYMPLYPPSFSTDLHFCIPCVLPPNIHIFHDSTFPHLNWVTFHSRYGSKAFYLLFCYKMFSCEYWCDMKKI